MHKHTLYLFYHIFRYLFIHLFVYRFIYLIICYICTDKKKHIATIRIASNVVLKILLKKKVRYMTIVMPVFFVIVNVSIVSSVSIFNSVEQVSVSCNASFARNVSIVCNCK